MGGTKTGGEVVDTGGTAGPSCLIVGVSACRSCCLLACVLVGADGFAVSPKLWSLGACNCVG